MERNRLNPHCNMIFGILLGFDDGFGVKSVRRQQSTCYALKIKNQEGVFNLLSEHSMTESWERYEDAAREAIRKIKDDLGLSDVVKEKKEYAGDSTDWELDVTAYAKGSNQLVVFECRKRGRNVEKAEMGSFAYTVNDLGAKGFVVSEKFLGKGAKEIAQHNGIQHIQFRWDETPRDSVLRWLNTVYATTSDHLEFNESICVQLGGTDPAEENP